MEPKSPAGRQAYVCSYLLYIGSQSARRDANWWHTEVADPAHAQAQGVFNCTVTTTGKYHSLELGQKKKNQLVGHSQLDSFEYSGMF